MFAEVGKVEDAVVISYKDTGRSKGFGFVTMKDDDAADEAVKKFNGFELEGRALIVDKARPMREEGEGGGNQCYAECSHSLSWVERARG